MVQQGGDGRLPLMIYDISPPLTPRIAVFPGDTPLTREVLLDHKRGDHITLSTVRATVHLGAHVDAESHYVPGGSAIHEEALDLYVGPCRVLDVPGVEGALIERNHLEALWEPLPGGSAAASGGLAESSHGAAPSRNAPGSLPKRLLLRTGRFPDPETFTPFPGMSPDLVDELAAGGVRLLGVDLPSVDPADSKTLPAHEACGRGGVRILEGLVLDAVEPGDYELIALPLSLVGFDASPVRAVLRR